MRASCFPPLGPSSERPEALSTALSAKPGVRSFSSSRPVSPCSSLRSQRFRGTGPAAERSGPGPAAIRRWTDPSRSGSKAPRGFGWRAQSRRRATCGRRLPLLRHGRAQHGPPKPKLVPHPQQALLRSRGGASLLRSRSTWRPSSQEFCNSTSNPLRCCLHLVVFDMQVSPLPPCPTL